MTYLDNWEYLVHMFKDSGRVASKCTLDRVNMKELRAARNSNEQYFRKECESLRRSQEKIETSFAEAQAELKPTKNIVNNAEE